MTTTTNIKQVKLNIMNQSQYDSAEKNPNELYMVTDAKIDYNELENKPVVDQTYNALSTNAQSGIAVESALSNFYNSLSSGQRTTLLANGTYNGKEVASNTIFTQYDGTFQKFTKEPVPAETSFTVTGTAPDNSNRYYVSKAIINNNPLYMAIAIDIITSVYTSTDGTSWTATNGVGGIPLIIHQGPLYKNGVWVSIDIGQIPVYSEDDGDSWDVGTGSYIYPETCFTICGNYFVGCNGYNEPCYSSDGKTWSQMNSGISDIYSMTYDGTNYIICTYYHKIYINPDITDDNGWSEVTFTTAPISNSYNYILYNNGVYYIYGVAYINGSWDGVVETSTDLLNWTHSDSIFPQHNGWEGGFPRLFCSGDFVCLEVNASLYYTTNSGLTWSDAVTTDGASSLCGSVLYNIKDGDVLTMDVTTSLGNILRPISYNKEEVDEKLAEKQKMLSGQNGIIVDQTNGLIYNYYEETETQPTPGTYGYSGKILIDRTHRKCYICLGYDYNSGSNIWKEIQTDAPVIKLPKLTDIAQEGTGIDFVVNAISNYNTVGTVSITDGVTSGLLNQNNHITANVGLDTTQPFEVTIKFNSTQHNSTQGDLIFCGKYPESMNIAIPYNGNKIHVDFTYYTNSYTYGHPDFTLVGVNTIELGNDYWVKAGWDGYEYYLKESTDGINYTLSDSYSSETHIKSMTDITLGTYNFRSGYFMGSFRGSLYLSEFSTSNNGVETWRAYAEEKPAITANIMVGADGTNAGAVGIVPAPIATDNDKYLRGDGTWEEVQSGSQPVYNSATESVIF